MATPTPLLDEMRGINLLLHSGRLDGAQMRLEAVVGNHPRFVEALRRLAGTKLALGEAQALACDHHARGPRHRSHRPPRSAPPTRLSGLPTRCARR